MTDGRTTDTWAAPAGERAGPAPTGTGEATTGTDSGTGPADGRRSRVEGATARNGRTRGPVSPATGALGAERDESGPSTGWTEPLIEARQLGFYYGDDCALRDVSLAIPRNRVTAIIGPSGCGKSTFLRCLNRMNDFVEGARVDGELLYAGKNLYDDDVDPVVLRRRIGMVFQKPNPFPKSVYDNVAYGLRIQGRDDELDAKVEAALRRAALWDEVHDRLDESGLELSGGQQQRLCIARAIAVDPEVLLMDEPASALDPIATGQIEELMADLAADYTVVIVTHNMQQAARVSDFTAVFLTGGVLAEFGPTRDVFEDPADGRVADYIAGKFG